MKQFNDFSDAYKAQIVEEFLDLKSQIESMTWEECLDNYCTLTESPDGEYVQLDTSDDNYIIRSVYVDKTVGGGCLVSADNITVKEEEDGWSNIVVYHQDLMWKTTPMMTSWNMYLRDSTGNPHVGYFCGPNDSVWYMTEDVEPLKSSKAKLEEDINDTFTEYLHECVYDAIEDIYIQQVLNVLPSTNADCLYTDICEILRAIPDPVDRWNFCYRKVADYYDTSQVRLDFLRSEIEKAS